MGMVWVESAITSIDSFPISKPTVKAYIGGCQMGPTKCSEIEQLKHTCVDEMKIKKSVGIAVKIVWSQTDIAKNSGGFF